jgi:gluconolactonase
MRIRFAVLACSFLLASALGTMSAAMAAEVALPVANFKPKAQNKIVPPGCVLRSVWMEGEFTEGPVPAANGTILFSDIGNRILRFGTTSETTTLFRNPSGKSNGLKFNPQGELVACEGAGPGGGRRISITDLQGKVRTLADKFEGKRFNSPNDLAIATNGNIYFTDPRYLGDEPRELDFEGVFLVEPSGNVKLATRDVEKPNGIIVTPDGKTVYVADNNSDPKGAHTLLVFDVQADGTLANKRILFDFGPNKRGIDGMTLDAKGNIYATAGEGSEGGVYVFDSQGVPMAFLHTPGVPTNCTFGIGKFANRLFITSAGLPAPTGKIQLYGLSCCDLLIPGYHIFPKATP